MSTKASSPFKDTAYFKDRNLQLHYCKQMAFLLSRLYNKPEAEIRPLVDQIFKRNTNGFKDIKFKIIKKNKYGDREFKIVNAGDFFNEAEANNYHVSPSLVCYTHSDTEQSVNSIGTVKFLKDRKLYKTKRQEAKAVGNKEDERTFDQIQNALKIFNNAQSGAMSSNGTPINNKSGHTTLTSTCRVLTSLANMMNERLLSGNRLFINYEKTIENFLSLIVHTDLPRLEAFMLTNNMRHATVDEVMTMVKRCTYYYWSDTGRMKMIQSFVELLSPVERSAILMISDLSGLLATNKDILIRFLQDFVHVPEYVKGKEGIEPSNADYYILCVGKLRRDPSVKVSDTESEEVKAAAKLREKELKQELEEYVNQLNEYHLSVEAKWKEFIELFFKVSVPPSGIYNIKEMVRENVLTSDTDSSIYTVDEILDLLGEDEDTQLNLNAALTYMIRMISVHQHAMFSKNMNVADNNLYRLNMKNEFMFGSYVTTLMSKHYYATQVMVEGVMNKTIEMEIKGVHLRSSKIAKAIKDFAHQLMRDILDAIYHKRKLDAARILAEVGNLERMIIEDIMVKRSPVWLTVNTIKDDTAYENPDSSIYQYHKLWESVFADKYGSPPDIPYRAYKLNTVMGSKTKLNSYLNELENSGFKDRFISYCDDRKDLNAIYLPIEVIEKTGVFPKEIIPAVDIRGIIQQNLKSVYAVLETTGLYFLNKKITRLVSDEH